MENKKKKKSKINYFVRTLIVILGVLIISLIISKFYIFEPKGEISNGIIILLGLLIILSLSEIFDSFSLGQFISLKKTVAEKNEKIVELKETNEKLFNLIVSNNISQGQSMTNNNGISEELVKSILSSVIKADKETTQNEENQKEKISEILVEEEEKTTNLSAPRKRLNLPKLEQYVLNKFIENKELKRYKFIENAQILVPQKDIDPISIHNPVFDGYVETENSEMFIEIKLRSAPLMLFRERLYVMLNKLYYYRISTKSNVYLNLILVERPTDESKQVSNSEERLINEFMPAMRLGLLKIDYIPLLEKEMKGLYRD
ncbi:hypothetical protein [Flavobacterium sp.]|jgi:hypothetical protein|uniref:hypothetical protein n=1 Tax=Flavobacterium sp. TaxID=239 RepID=UPI0037BF2FC9